MADKDVKLVIQAKNAASKAIDAVSDSLKDLGIVQTKTGESARSMDGLLGQLGSEFKKLNSEVSGLAALGKIADQLGKAEGAVKRLQETTRSSAQDFANLARQTEAASQATARLKGEADTLSRTYAEQKAAVAAARKEQSAANSELAKAERLLTQVTAKAAKHTSANPFGSAADSAGVFAAAEVQKAKAAADDAAGDFSRLNGELAETAKRQKDIAAEVSAAVSAERKLTVETEKMAAATKGSAEALGQAREQLAGIQAIASEASTALGGLAVDEEKIAAATKAATAEMERSKAVLDALKRYSTGGSGFADPKAAAAQQAQRAEMQKTLDLWKTLEAEVHRLAAAMKETATPTEQQTQAFQKTVAAARAAKDEYEALRDALAKLQGSTQGSFSALNGVDGGLRQIKQTTQETGEAASGLRGFFSGIFDAFKGEGREAMSLMQRIRGEVLSLATAYLGLYNAFSQIGGVIDAFRKIEAAQNRLSVAFGQNKDQVGQEFDFLSRTAAKLGIEFGTLADEYSKFAIAAKTANFESDSTRKIFLSVAEAARVNKLSTDQMSGVFLALQQMISKGKISSEELRRQMGDRLPGAFDLFAKALGKSTSELDKMMQAGEALADESNLLKVADQFDKTFGPQLAESLRTTTTLMGQFWNEVFQAQVRVGDGGFIQAFNGLLRDMIGYFRSRDGRDFFLSIGAALGTATNAIKFFVDNFGLLVEGVKLLVSYKLASWFLGAVGGVNGLATAFATFRSTMTGAVAGFTMLQTQAGIAGAALTALTGIVNVARAAFMAFWPTLLATGVAYALGTVLSKWAGGVDDVTKHLDEHKRIMGEVITAYESVKTKTDDWQKAIKGVTLDQANASFRNLKKDFDDLKGQLTSGNVLGFKFWEDGILGTAKALNDLRDKFREGKVTAAEFRAQLEQIYSGTASDSARQYIEQQLEIARKAEDVERETAKAALTAKGMGSTLDDVQKVAGSTADAMKKLTGSINDVNTAAGAEALKKYTDALNALKETIPDLKKEMDTLKNVEDIKAKANAARAALGGLNLTPEQFDFRNSEISATEKRAINVEIGADMKTVFEEIAKNTGTTVEGLTKLKDSEGFRNKAYKLPGEGGYTIGIGHTKHAGGIQPTADMQLSDAEVYKQFAADVKMFADQVDKLVKVPLTPEMKDALVSLQFNSGGLGAKDGRAKILDPLNNGDYAAAAEGIRNFRTSAAGGDLQSRRNKEADLFLSGGTSNAQIDEARYETEAKISEEKKKQEESAQHNLTLAQTDATYAQAKLDGLTKEEIVEHEINKWKEQNKGATDEQIAQYTKIAEQKADIILKEQQEAQQKKEIAAVNKTITDLETTRNLLLQQRKYAEDQGDATKAQELTTQIQGVNEQLKQAIDNAIQFWQGIGGPQADAAILKLQTTAMGLNNIGQKSAITGKTINESLANGLVGAFDDFAQAIANGEDALTALGTAFRKFAANFLIEIAKMILKQAILNALQGGGGANGGIGGGIASLIGGLFHEGGVVGPGMDTRAISPGWFSNAMRYHDGGVPGLKPGEVPAILQTGEEVLTRDDPRNVMNGGAGPGRPAIKIVNTFDSGDVVSEGLNSAVGEETLVNVVRRNASAIREVLG